MQAMTVASMGARGPRWFFAAAILGISWNAYGVYQFFGSLTQTADTLMAAGMTAGQAEVLLGLPAWIAIVFGLGVLGGLVGSIALLARRTQAPPVLAASLLAYILLLAGDTYHGVFVAMPSQLAILAAVVVIAGVLYGIARVARNRGWLR